MRWGHQACSVSTAGDSGDRFFEWKIGGNWGKSGKIRGNWGEIRKIGKIDVKAKVYHLQNMGSYPPGPSSGNTGFSLSI